MPQRTGMRSIPAGLLIALLTSIGPTPALSATANVSLEKLDTVYKFQNDGTGQISVHTKWKALTAAGARQISQFSISYVSEFEEVRVTSFQTLKNKSAALPGDPKQVFDAAPAAGNGAPVFSGSKVKQFVLPSVEAGDEVEYEYTTIVQHPPSRVTSGRSTTHKICLRRLRIRNLGHTSRPKGLFPSQSRDPTHLDSGSWSSHRKMGAQEH